ncbi:MAG: AsmA family protein [Porticoccaceae bacterium]|nr:AsmA family protein [Porticoccaceae bacterium]
MKKLLKVLVGGVLIIVLLLAAVVAYVMFAIDPNDYKAEIQEAAAEQGINLNITGDLGWQVVPNLAIRIGATDVSSSTQAIPDTHFDNASLSLAWLPLLKKQVHVKAITIDGADIVITDSAEAATTAAAPVAAASAETTADSAFGIAVDSIKITDSRVTLPGDTLPGEKGSADTVLSNLTFTGKKINLEGNSFPINLSFDYSDGSLPKPLDINLNANVIFNQQTEEVKVDGLVIKFGDTTITGETVVKLSAPKTLIANLKGDSIDLNRYVAGSEGEGSSSTSSGSSQASSKQAEALFAPLAAPIAFLEGGKGAIELNWGKLAMDGLTMESIHVGMTIAGSTVNINDFSANTLGGTINATARLGNVTGRTPNVSYTAQLANISLAEAGKAFADDADTGGTLNATVKGTSKGATGDALFDNLSSSGTLQVVDPELKTINIEQSYCKLAAMVEKVPLKTDWPAGTKLNNLDGKFRMQGRTLILDGVSSGVGNLALTSTGKVDLRAGAFDIVVVSRLNGTQTSETGCVVESTKLHNRDIPLRCKATFESVGAKSCLPDGDIVRQLAKDEIMKKISEKAGLSEEAGQAVDNLLKGIFGRKKTD